MSFISHLRRITVRAISGKLDFLDIIIFKNESCYAHMSFNVKRSRINF